jgi:protein-disulfide isomerase-like protein with CxxC motif
VNRGSASSRSVVDVTVELVEFTDPACSYAWGTEPKVRRLRWQYGHRLRWRRVMIGMHAPGWTDGAYGRDLDDPALPQAASDYWAGVGGLTGMPFPSPLHHIHGSTEARAGW